MTVETDADTRKRLARNLVDIGEEGFYRLYQQWGDYTSLAGDTLLDKVINFVQELERQKALGWLIHAAQEAYPQYVWEKRTASLQPEKKYYVATSRVQQEVIQKFKIPPYQFERVYEPRQADYLVFDLDYPPEDWIRYLGHQIAEPSYDKIVFVKLEKPHNAEDIHISGNHILSLLYRVRDPHVYEFQVCHTPDDMVRKLGTLLQNDRDREARDARVAEMVMASNRLPS
jgi:hypothetical protein